MCLAHAVSNAETGEKTMSDITYDWMQFETQATTDLPIRRMVRTSKPYRREDEFRSALDRYLADYRKHRDRIANKGRHPIL
jgi:hypothetical protein